MKSACVWMSALGLLLAACAPAAVPAEAPASGGAELLQWSEPPAMTIDTARTYTATIDVANKGKIVIELLDDVAPITVNNFVFLARQGFFDGTTFHRVIPGFMAQGGDPTGTGMGGPGYQFQDEFDPAVTFDGPGLLAMANAGPGTNGSQFFITYAPTPHLNGAHTIFGRVTSGLEVALALSERDPQSASAPGDVITSITIDEQ